MLWRLPLALLFVFAPLHAGVVFTDNFDSGASALWSNQRGNWAVSGGAYYAQSPGNSPLTATLLPYVLGDFTVEADVINNNDGGIWVRTDEYANAGVVLILRSSQVYWHVITSPTAGPWTQYGLASHSGVTHVKVTGTANLLEAYLNGGSAPITSLDLSTVSRPGYDYSTGRAGLYSYSGVSFDNVVLSTNSVPEPFSWTLLVPGVAVLALVRRRTRFR